MSTQKRTGAVKIEKIIGKYRKQISSKNKIVDDPRNFQVPKKYQESKYYIIKRE